MTEKITPSIGQIERQVPGLTPDVSGKDGKIQKESNFFTSINKLVPDEAINDADVDEIKKVVGGVINELEKLPEQLKNDLRDRKKYAWIGLGLGVLTITIAAGWEIKRGGRDLRTLIDYAPVIKKKIANLKPNITAKKEK